MLLAIFECYQDQGISRIEGSSKFHIAARANIHAFVIGPYYYCLCNGNVHLNR